MFNDGAENTLCQIALTFSCSTPLCLFIPPFFCSKSLPEGGGKKTVGSIPGHQDSAVVFSLTM